MQIGILGGTFNPVHNGHLHIAAEVRTRCQLDQIWFLPAWQPPHKEVAQDVCFRDRLAMVELAVREIPAYMVSDLEGRRGGRSFSVQTLEELRRTYPDHEFTFIMGLDSFAEIGLWKSYARLFELCHIAVAARPGFEGDLYRLLPVAVADRFCYDADALKLRGRSGFSVQLVKQTSADISSTEIRRRLTSGLSTDGLLPAAVQAYIVQHRLYGKSPAN